MNRKDSYLQAQFYRIKAGRGPKKAIVAVGASILTAIYHMLKNGTMCQDLDRRHFDRRSYDQQKRRLVKRLADFAGLWRSSPSPPKLNFPLYAL